MLEFMVELTDLVTTLTKLAKLSDPSSRYVRMVLFVPCSCIRDTVSIRYGPTPSVILLLASWSALLSDEFEDTFITAFAERITRG
jgi:hypothetical protein